MPTPATPSSHVLDLFAVPEVVEPLPGALTDSVRAGDLVLSPGRDAAVQAWLSPLLARLAVRLDERPDRRAQDLRVAMPVPARDGAWVVEGWAASRWEPGTTACLDPAVTLAAGRLLHARLAPLVTEPPAVVLERTDARARAERLAFAGGADLRAAAGTLPAGAAGLVRRVADLLDGLDPDAASPAATRHQLVHADLAGHVLLDAAGAPVVVDVDPAWRPPLWAEAVAALDLVRGGADPARLDRYAGAATRAALLRAVLFGALVDPAADVAAYTAVLDRLDVVDLGGHDGLPRPDPVAETEELHRG